MFFANRLRPAMSFLWKKNTKGFSRTTVRDRARVRVRVRARVWVTCLRCLSFPISSFDVFFCLPSVLTVEEVQQHLSSFVRRS